MHQNSKRKRVVKYIKTKMVYEKYEIDLIELNKSMLLKPKWN